LADRTDACWRDLAGAIVEGAIKEYRAELLREIRECHPSAKAASLEGWFRGEWCATLCEPFGIDPTRIAPEIRSQVFGEFLGDGDD
jgi:hypothetical protein